jgi:hypothetical protein
LGINLTKKDFPKGGFVITCYKLAGMKQACFLLIFVLGSIVSFSQTKRIAHRSHSGKNNTIFFSSTGNFGLPEEHKKEKAKKANPKDSLQIRKAKKDSLDAELKRRNSPLKDSVPPKPQVGRVEMMKTEVAVVISAARYVVHL